MAILWSLWHVPAFLFPGMPHATMAFVPTALFTAFFGVWLAAVFYRTGGSVLATMAAHLGLNATQGVGGVDLSSGVYLWSLAGLFGVLAVIGTSCCGGARWQRLAKLSVARADALPPSHCNLELSHSL